MRAIDAKDEPVTYTEWRALYQNDINYGYSLMPSEVRADLKDALIAEQRGLCAYTGIRIDASRSHIEHLLPQAHCERGREDVAYRNMVACYPAPDGAYIPFGALLKGSWPSRAEQHLFVSPRSADCEARFMFNLRGEISVAESDEAAGKTVRRIGLDNQRLVALREAAINATLDLRGKRPSLLDLKSSRMRLSALEKAERAESRSRLEPFCFALKQALRKHIRRLEAIRESRNDRQR